MCKFNNTIQKIFLITFLAGLAACSNKEKEKQSDVSTNISEKPSGPNVVFILTDDQGWGDIHSHGNQILETPTLDQLAKDGARFNRFYVSPLCAPTRASILTGREHLRTGTISVSRGMERMRGEETTIAEIFKENGYTTGCFGKWHNGENYPENPRGQGFDEFLGFCAGHWNNYFDTTLEHNGQPVKTKGYITDVLADKAIDFIEKNKENQTPFFCYIPFNAPHSPFQVPDQYFDKYKNKGLNDKDACVYGMCENIDDNIARILNRLDSLNLSENTIVVFATDNGPNGKRFNGGMKGWKGHVDEGGVRVPLFIRWPKHIAQNKTVETLAAHIDLLPTLTELCGIDIPDGLEIDGNSLVPVLTGIQKVVAQNRHIFTHVNFMDELKSTPGALRNERYRLTAKSDGFKLYDIQTDPGQKRDISAEESEVFKHLKTMYQNWFRQITKNISSETPPIYTGFEKAARIELTVQEALFNGHICFQEGHGWANDWLIHWISKSDSIWWNVEGIQPAKYNVSLKYTCPQKDIGSKVSIHVGTHTITGEIDQAFDPPFIPSPDRVKRQEVYEKPWKTLELGQIEVPKGRHLFSLNALNIPGRQVAQIKSIVLKKIN